MKDLYYAITKALEVTSKVKTCPRCFQSDEILASRHLDHEFRWYPQWNSVIRRGTQLIHKHAYYICYQRKTPRV